MIYDGNLQDEPTVVVPPNTTDEEFSLNWEEIRSSVDAFPVEYALTPRGEDIDTALLPMVCHRVKVQRYVHVTYWHYYCTLLIWGRSLQFHVQIKFWPNHMDLHNNIIITVVLHYIAMTYIIILSQTQEHAQWN